MLCGWMWQKRNRKGYVWRKEIMVMSVPSIGLATQHLGQDCSAWLMEQWILKYGSKFWMKMSERLSVNWSSGESGSCGKQQPRGHKWFYKRIRGIKLMFCNGHARTLTLIKEKLHERTWRKQFKWGNLPTTRSWSCKEDEPAKGWSRYWKYFVAAAAAVGGWTKYRDKRLISP